jgi:hypothetical protein
MKKLIILLFLTSCKISDDIDLYSNATEIVTSSDILSLENNETEVFFFDTIDGKFIGIKNNQQIEVPVSLDLDFDVIEDSYGYRAKINKLIQINDRYDLVEGTVDKFLNSQGLIRNDTLYNIQGFLERTKGNYLLFDKQKFNFIELEDGFYINNFVENPIQVMNEKFFYLKKGQNGYKDEIKYLDLNDLSIEPQTFYSFEDIRSFIINHKMDLIFNSKEGNRYISNETGKEFFVDNDLLNSFFIGIDKKFYASQSYSLTFDSPLRAIYNIDIKGNSVVQTENFYFDSNNYPEISFLGYSDIVIPNYNNNIIISKNNGTGSIYFYEFYPEINTINPLDIVINGVDYVDYYNNDFLIITDHYNSSNIRLRKIDFSNLSSTIEIDLGPSENGIILNKSNGSIFGLSTKLDLSTKSQISKLIEIKKNNTITEIELTNPLHSYFSIIN